MSASTDQVAKVLAEADTHGWTGAVPAWLGDPSQRGIGAFIDHTLLKPEATPADIDHAADTGKQFGTASVCINGRWVARVKQRLAGSPVRTCAVIAFPLGATVTAIKVEEARRAVGDGADELDMVMSIGEAKAGDWEEVAKDIAAVIAGAGKVPVKVILESALAHAVGDRAGVSGCPGCRGAVREDVVGISRGRRSHRTGGAADAAYGRDEGRSKGIGRCSDQRDGASFPGSRSQSARCLGYRRNVGHRGAERPDTHRALQARAGSGTGTARILRRRDFIRALASVPSASLRHPLRSWSPLAVASFHAALGVQRGTLYFYLLLARLEARGENGRRRSSGDRQRRVIRRVERSGVGQACRRR